MDELHGYTAKAITDATPKPLTRTLKANSLIRIAPFKGSTFNGCGSATPNSPSEGYAPSTAPTTCAACILVTSTGQAFQSSGL